jgi:hypothetical protein
MSDALPRITIPPEPEPPPASGGAADDPLLALIELLRAPHGKVEPIELVRALIEEGRRFAATPSGRRWAALLARSSLVENGWLLWHRAELDGRLRAIAGSGESPAAMVEEVLRRLVAGDLERYVGLLGALAAEQALADARPDDRAAPA